MGPLKAPAGHNEAFLISAEAARHLAYYKAGDSSGVLAPRGWHCFGTYGSNGSSLYVSANPINAANLFSTSWSGFAGSAIEISISDGDTSGRFAVAQVIARVFPAYKEFVKNVIGENIEPASNFPSGPFPHDRLQYRSQKVVEFLTPPNSEGMGTNSRLQKDPDSIGGVAILMGQAPDLLFLAIRLPPEQHGLASTIVQQTERETGHLDR